MRQSILGALLALALVALAVPALAGGSATVRLDETPGDVVAGEPWRFGFIVRQHDITPTNEVTPIVRARNVETGDEVTVTARQEGPVGHFVAELTLPVAGAWKWAIYPEPYAETSFETLPVVDERGTSPLRLQASVQTGACDDLGDIAFSLGEVASQETNVKSTQMPVTLGAGIVATPLSELLSTGHAITVSTGDRESGPVACGDVTGLSGTLDSDLAEVVLGLQGPDRARNVGVAVLRPAGEQTAVALYLLDTSQLDAVPLTGATTTIEIVGGRTEEWAFQPRSITIVAGDTVAWVNNSDSAHTITGDDLSFADSGMLDPGQTFQQTFDDPGTYRYRCGPHPWMEGTVVVA